MRFYDIVFCQLHELLIGDFLSIQQNQLTTIPYSAFFLSIHIKKASTSFVSIIVREVVVVEEVTKESAALEAALLTLLRFSP